MRILAICASVAIAGLCFTACSNVEIIREYYDSGELLSEVPYKNGIKNGIEKGYRKNGALLHTLSYENDKAVSGKCGNGKILTKDELDKITQESYLIYEFCQ